MGYIRDRVFILRHEPLREHDAWISMYGQKYGKIVGIARGHRRPTGKQIGHMEPLVLAEVMVAEGKKYDKVAVSRVIQPFHALRGDLPKVVILSSAFSLADILTRPGVGDERLFRLIQELADSLSALNETPSAERAQLIYSWFALRLLDHLGHIASFDRCISCRGALHEPLYAAPSMGGAVCEACRATLDYFHQPMPAVAWKLLRMIQGASCQDIARVSAPKSVFRQANHFISQVLEQIPADGEPHGFRTIAAVLL